MTATICAKYKNVDGWHVFQSDELPGLYVASQNAERAFNDVAPSIQMLVKLDEGIDCEVVPATSFNDFIASIKHHGAEDGSSVVLANKQYVLLSHAA